MKYVWEQYEQYELRAKRGCSFPFCGFFGAHFVTPQKGNPKEGFLCIPPKVGDITLGNSIGYRNLNLMGDITLGNSIGYWKSHWWYHSRNSSHGSNFLLNRFQWIVSHGMALLLTHWLVASTHKESGRRQRRKNAAGWAEQSSQQVDTGMRDKIVGGGDN